MGFLQRFRNPRRPPSERELQEGKVLYDFSDPDEEQRRRASIARLEAELAPFLSDLRAAGLDVRGLEDLGRLWNYPTDTDVRHAPLLVKWLPRIANRGTRLGVVMALADPRTLAAAPEGTDVLLEEFEDLGRDDSYRWQVANALLGRRDATRHDEYLKLIADQRYGQAREPLLELVADLGLPAGRAALADLTLDPEVGPAAKEVLSTRR